MAKYQVITSSKIDSQLLQHVSFLSRVSIPAAKRFRKDYAEVLDRLGKNPFQFPFDADPNLPSDLYHKALFSKWYKALFIIEGSTVYLDAVVDCRQSINTYDL